MLHYTMPLDAVRGDVSYHNGNHKTMVCVCYHALAGVPVGSVRVHSHAASEGVILVRVQLGFS